MKVFILFSLDILSKEFKAAKFFIYRPGKIFLVVVGPIFNTKFLSL